MPTKNKLADLRSCLFEQLEKLQAAENPSIEIQRSKAMAQVSGQILSSVKVQLQFVQVLGADRVPALAEQTSDFFREEPKKGLNTGKQLGAVRTIGEK